MSENPCKAQPSVVDRATFEQQLEGLRAREKAHTRAGDAIAAARRRLPMVEVAADSPLLGPDGPMTLLDAFEGRRQMIAYYFMWWPGRLAAEQCEGCTWVMSHVGELAYLHSRDITFAVFCQGRNTAYGFADAQTSYEESLRYRAFMGWAMPWYSAQPSLESLLVGRELGLFHLVCYLRDGDRVFETYWTKRRGAEAVDYSYALMDLTVFGRQEAWEDSPAGWQRLSTPRGPWAGLPTGRRCGSGRADVPQHSGRASTPTAPMTWAPPAPARRPIPITATDGGERAEEQSRLVDQVSLAVDPVVPSVGLPRCGRDGFVPVRRAGWATISSISEPSRVVPSSLTTVSTGRAFPTDAATSVCSVTCRSITREGTPFARRPGLIHKS